MNNFLMFFFSRKFAIPFIFLSVILSSPAKILAQDGDVQQDTTTTEGEFVGVVQDKTYENSTAGEFTPGKGFTLFKTDLASLNISAYGLVRYINQMPGYQSYEDHLGRSQVSDTRNDIWWHRTIVWFSGFFYNPKFRYTISVWGLNATNQVLIFGNLQYAINKAIVPGVGIGPNLGTRSMQGPWPFFLASDRVLAEEFFRPGFTMSAWVSGEPISRFRYWVAVGNNLSQLGITASQMSRYLSTSASVWWMPTTGEFGPRGGSGDFEQHQELATRFGASYTHCRESRQSDIGQSSAETQVKLSDGLLFFETNSLANGVTVTSADFDEGSIDLGMKIKGLHLQVEYYFRYLSNFNLYLENTQMDLSTVPNTILDHGFYALASYEIIPFTLQLYASTSWIYDQFQRYPWEILGGLNFYPAGTRSLRFNLQAMHVDQSPASSSFGYYIGGQTGITISTGIDFLF
jgi:hypothetical protein